MLLTSDLLVMNLSIELKLKNQRKKEKAIITCGALSRHIQMLSNAKLWSHTVAWSLCGVSSTVSLVESLIESTESLQSRCSHSSLSLSSLE